MQSYSLTQVPDHVLLKDLAVLVTQDRATTAMLLAHIAEVEERKLHAPAAHASMFLYCVHELHMSEDVAYKRIRAARAARQFPAIFEAIANGRLHLAAVVLLAPHLQPANADELLAVCAHRTKAEIELLLARRFPRPDLPTLMHAVVHTISPAAVGAGSYALVPELAPAAESNSHDFMEPLAPGPVVPSSGPRIAASMEPVPSRPKLTPLSADRVAWQLTVDRTTHEKLLYAKALLGHAIPSGDLDQVLDRALDALVEKLEKRKFAKCSRSGRQRGSSNPRCIPARVRRAVHERDGGQCTFVSDTGKRCEARSRLEFDHVHPVARGGQATIDGIRLRCRAHNQLAADRTYGAGFMQEKRKQVHVRADEPRAIQTPASAASAENDVTPWLRALGFTAQEARRGAELCAHIPEAAIEERLRFALRGLAPNGSHRAAVTSGGPVGPQCGRSVGIVGHSRA